MEIGCWSSGGGTACSLHESSSGFNDSGWSSLDELVLSTRNN